MSRITLITYFDDKNLSIVNNYIKDISINMCKLPYGIDDNNRYSIDNLPYHFTIFATDKENQDKLLNICKSINISKIKLKINDVKIMNAKNNSFVLYFSIEENSDLKYLQRCFYEKISGGKYNPDTFTFHMTLHIDKDEKLIYELLKIIKQDFKPFYLEFDKLVLYNYPGNMIKVIDL